MAKKINIDSTELLVDFKTAKNKREQINILADLHCCSPRTIAELLKQLGALEGADIKPSQFSNVYHPVPPAKPRNKGGRPATVFDYPKAREMVGQGVSPTEIALAVNVSRRTVENWMKKNGLWPRKEDKSVKKETEEQAPVAKDTNIPDKDGGKTAPRITMEPREAPTAVAMADAETMTLGGFKSVLHTLLGTQLDGGQLLIDGRVVHGVEGFEVTVRNNEICVDLRLAEAG